MKATLAILLLVSYCLPAVAADAQRDGNWWRQLPRETKETYLVGMFDGTNAAVLMSTSKELNAELYKQLRGVTTPQVADGLDQFYRDFRNRAIRVEAALRPVVGAIHGESAGELDAEIRMLRSIDWSDQTPAAGG